MDVVAMRECVTEHLKTAREDRKPTLVEAFTYRYRGHSAADPEVYREKEEVEEWRQKDPIETFARRLEEEGIIDSGHLDELREEVEKQVIECGRVRRRLPGAAARLPLRQPLRGRGRERGLVRGRRAHPRPVPRRARARGGREGPRPRPPRGRRRLRRASRQRLGRGQPASRGSARRRGPGGRGGADRRRAGFRGRGRRRAERAIEVFD